MAGGGVSPCLTLEALPKTQKEAGGWLRRRGTGPGQETRRRMRRTEGPLSIVLVYTTSLVNRQTLHTFSNLKTSIFFVNIRTE